MNTLKKSSTLRGADGLPPIGSILDQYQYPTSLIDAEQGLNTLLGVGIGLPPMNFDQVGEQGGQFSSSVQMMQPIETNRATNSIVGSMQLAAVRKNAMLPGSSNQNAAKLKIESTNF